MRDKVKGKIEKHYNILINGQKCKILNYKIENSRLTIITKLKNENLWLNRDEIGEICIEEENERHLFFVKWHSSLFDATIFYYYYTIIEDHY